MDYFQFPRMGAAPWAGAQFSYAGWVPTISGHLSFSLIGTHRPPPRGQLLNVPLGAGESRLVVVHRRRKALDYPFPSELVRLVKPEIAQDYILIGVSRPACVPFLSPEGIKAVHDEQGVLAGVVIVVPEEAHKHHRKLRKRFFEQLGDLVEGDSEASEATAGEIMELVERSRAAGVASVTLPFALFRSGEFHMWFDMKTFLGREVHPQAIPPSDEEMALAVLLPQQAYFFVKDETHRHYHHEPSSDQILLLTRLTGGTTREEHNENEIAWRRQTLWGLARVVSQFRRHDRLNDHKKALGVLSYAEAFQTTLARMRRTPDLADPFESHKDLTLYDFAHTRSSVEALESLAGWRRSGLLQLFAVLSGVFLSSLALWSGSVEIRPVLCPEDANPPLCPPLERGNAVDLVLWITEHPLEFTSVLVVAGYAIFLLIFKDFHLVPLARPIGRLFRAMGTSVARRLSGKHPRRGESLGFWFTILLHAVLTYGLGYVAIASLMRGG